MSVNQVDTWWTPDVCAELEKLWNDGLSARQIAEILGATSRNAVLGKLGRMKLLGTRPRDTARLNAKMGGRPKGAPKPPKPRAKKTYNNLAAYNAARRAGEAPRPLPMPVIEDATFAKPWLERKFGECAFVVGGDGADSLSCCRPVKGAASYCPGHYARMYIKPRTSPEGLARWAVRAAA